MELLRELEDLMLLLAGALPGDGSPAARGAGAGGQGQHALVDRARGQPLLRLRVPTSLAWLGGYRAPARGLNSAYE